jgi:50S ribosomal protein L16 3-hydroxylase
LQDFARAALLQIAQDPAVLQRALGEYLTEPKAQVWFASSKDGLPSTSAIRLDRKTRMMYDARHVFINGESYRAGGRDAELMRRLADGRALSAQDHRRASVAARSLLQEWALTGWLHAA